MTTPKWQDFYAAHFHRLSEAEVATWEWEMREGPRKIRNFSQELLMSAIRRLAGNKDREGRVIPAKLKDVQDEMFAIMREAKKADADSLPASVCSDCANTGFYTGFRTLFDSDRREKVVGLCDETKCGTPECQQHKGGVVCFDLAIPCRCKRGYDMMTAKPGYQSHAAIKRLQDMADSHNRQIRQGAPAVKVDPVRASEVGVTAEKIAEQYQDMPF